MPSSREGQGAARSWLRVFRDEPNATAVGGRLADLHLCARDDGLQHVGAQTIAAEVVEHAADRGSGVVSRSMNQLPRPPCDAAVSCATVRDSALPGNIPELVRLAHRPRGVSTPNERPYGVARHLHARASVT